jgi:protein-tyrosine phosphatase
MPRAPMIDLHCHILPGVDDGARSLEESVALCRLAAADGCTAMIATPHQRRGEWWNDDREQLRQLAHQVQETVGDSLTVRLGGEVHGDPDLLSEVERLPEGGIQPLAGSRYLLIELDVYTTPAAAIHLIHEIVVAGWRPILAHPELIPWLAPDPEMLRRLVGLGATAQVTAMSLTGDFGRRPQQEAWRMLDAGLVHFVASDAHDVRRRPPGLRRAYQMIAARSGEETARRLTTDNPRAVLEDQPLPASSGEIP